MGSQLLQIKCSRAHETTAILQEQKFEILFDIGAHAILMDTTARRFHPSPQVLSSLPRESRAEREGRKCSVGFLRPFLELIYIYEYS